MSIIICMFVLRLNIALKSNCMAAVVRSSSLLFQPLLFSGGVNQKKESASKTIERKLFHDVSD